MYTHTHTHTYIHIHIYTHTYTYTYTYIQHYTQHTIHTIHFTYHNTRDSDSIVRALAKLKTQIRHRAANMYVVVVSLNIEPILEIWHNILKTMLLPYWKSHIEDCSLNACALANRSVSVLLLNGHCSCDINTYCGGNH